VAPVEAGDPARFCLLTLTLPDAVNCHFVASPAETPQPPSRSRRRDWWKIPLFVGVFAGAIALEDYSNSKGGVLLLLLLAYIVVRAIYLLIRLVIRLVRKR